VHPFILGEGSGEKRKNKEEKGPKISIPTEKK